MRRKRKLPPMLKQMLKQSSCRLKQKAVTGASCEDCCSRTAGHSQKHLLLT